MDVIFILVVVAGATLYFLRRLGPRMVEATRQGPWLGEYFRAVRKGATPADAIYATLNVLRYREPWAQLTESEVRAFADTLGQLDEPRHFTEVLAEVELTGDMSHVRDIKDLERFVNRMNSK